MRVQKFLYIIVFMMMVTTYLPLFYNNVPAFFRSHHLWTLLWGISLMVLQPRVFFSKPMLVIYLYGLLLLLATLSIWSYMDWWNNRLLFDELYHFAVSVSVISYFYQTRNYIDLAKITQWALIFILITAAMSIVSSYVDPLYARRLVASSFAKGNEDIIATYKSFGGGSYSTAIVFMSILPLFIYYYKNKNIKFISPIIVIGSIVLIFIALISIQLVANVLLAFIFALIALIGIKKYKYVLVVLSILGFIIFSIPQKTYVESFLSLGKTFENYQEVSFKFNEMAMYIEEGGLHDENSTNSHIKSGQQSIINRNATAQRAERYPMLINVFKQYPFVGINFIGIRDAVKSGYNVDGGHLYWMNKLTTMGIIGLLFFLMMFIFPIKNNLMQMSSEYKLYYIYACLAMLSYGFLKGFNGREAWYTFFILFPGMYYLPLLQNKEKKNTTSKKIKTIITKYKETTSFE